MNWASFGYGILAGMAIIGVPSVGVSLYAFKNPKIVTRAVIRSQMGHKKVKT